MFFGKSKTSVLLNIFILGVLSVGIWFYIQQQIVGEREIEFELQLKVRPGPGVGSVVVLARSVDGRSDSDAVTVKLRGSKAKLDEITKVAVITLSPKREDFDGAPVGRPLAVKVQLNEEHLNLPPEVKIVQAPAVLVELDEEVSKVLPVELNFSRAAQEKIAALAERWKRLDEYTVRVTGPGFLLSGDWRPVTQEIRDDQLPRPGHTSLLTVRLMENIRDYSRGTPYKYILRFDEPAVRLQLSVTEEQVTEYLRKIPVGVRAPDDQWTQDYKVSFGTLEWDVEISVPKSKEGWLTRDKIRLYAILEGEDAEPGRHNVRIELVYREGRWPEWAKIISPVAGTKILAVVTGKE